MNQIASLINSWFPTGNDPTLTVDGLSSLAMVKMTETDVLVGVLVIYSLVTVYMLLARRKRVDLALVIYFAAYLPMVQALYLIPEIL